MGTPDFATALLKEIVARGHEVAAVYSQPPRPAGRGLAEKKSSVHLYAESLGLPVRTPKSLRDAQAQRDFAALDADVAVVAAYGLLLPQPILDAPKHGCLNLHGSLLPALLAGDTESGVCVMDVDLELDTGAVHAVVHTPIAADDTAASLRARLSEIGSELLVETLRAGLAEGRPQVGEVTYAAKIDPSESCLDWSRPAVEIDRTVRVGGAWTRFRGARLKVHAVSIDDVDHPLVPPGTLRGAAVVCGEGAVVLREVQPEGRGRQTFTEWRNGARPADDERLGP